MTTQSTEGQAALHKQWTELVNRLSRGATEITYIEAWSSMTWRCLMITDESSEVVVEWV